MNYFFGTSKNFSVTHKFTGMNNLMDQSRTRQTLPGRNTLHHPGKLLPSQKIHDFSPQKKVEHCPTLLSLTINKKTTTSNILNLSRYIIYHTLLMLIPSTHSP